MLIQAGWVRQIVFNVSKNYIFKSIKSKTSKANPIT